VLGPQDDYFAADQVAAFLAGPWTVSPRGDRMACFLDGTPLTHAKGHDIVSDGVAMGAIQVPGNGLPIVLMADRQSTGGYPKIATVIGPDLGRLAQVRGGTRLSFRRVSVAEAVAARRAEREFLREPVPREPVVRTDFASDFLLGLNLVGGVTDGRA
jgi:allophanate hydrolase subunit 2